MNAVVNESRENLAEFRAAGPGGRLKAARASLGLEPRKIAAQLHLSTDMVTAIERDDYSAMPARVFVRGYIKNYARVVGLPAESLLKQLEGQFPDEAAKNDLDRVGTDIRRELRSSHGLVRLMTWVIVLGLVVLFVLWWRGHLDWRLEVDGTATTTTEEDASGTDLAGDEGMLALPGVSTNQAPTGTVDRSGETEPAPVAPSVAEPEVKESMPAEAATAHPAEPSPETVVEAAGVAATARTADSQPLPSDAKLEETVAAVVTAERQAVADDKVVIEFAEPCWVDIRGSAGGYKLYGEMAAGRTETLSGVPPYRMIIGNAKATRISIDGKPFNLAPHTRGNVARFALTTN